MRMASLISGAVAGGLLALTAYAASGQELPPGPNRRLVYGNCRTCHDLQYLIESAGVPRSTWNDLLDSMKQYGLRIAPEDRAKILDYLSTYLGPNPPPKTAAAPPVPQAPIDAAELFRDQCSGCHQPNGEGVPGQFPRLAQNPDLFLARDYPVRVVLFGLSGKITVNGDHLNSEMPPLNVLTDQEIAAVVNFVRGAWGNDKLRPAGFKPIDAAAVADVRKKKLTPAQVHGHRKELKAAAAGK
jgi:mono/diheme cytochrome c family protein